MFTMMPLDPLIVYLLIRLAVAIVGFILVLREFYRDRMRVKTFLLWSLAAIFIPLLTIIAYVIIGRTSYPENAFDNRSLSDE